jgi:heme-degrading monooxygenase HmoA
MIATLVTFTYSDNFSEEKIRRIAESARPKFENMPGLRSKAFSFNEENNCAKNYYVWEDENAARNFFTETNIDNIGEIYGVRPSVEFLEVATLVDNHSGS